MLSGSIRMEGMQKHQYWMDKESLALLQLSGFQLSLFFLLFVCKAGKVFDYKPHFPPLKFVSYQNYLHVKSFVCG